MGLGKLKPAISTLKAEDYFLLRSNILATRITHELGDQ